MIENVKMKTRDIEKNIFKRMKQIFQNEFFRLKSRELLFSLYQAQSIIQNHNLSRGLIAENILRSFLKTTLPKRIRISQGFIEYDGLLSPQCDIILYDCINYAPLYSYGDIDVIPNEAVLATIEVKSRINRKEFGKVLHVFEILQSMRVSHKYIFVYDCVQTKTIREYFRYSSNRITYDYDNFNALPEAIVSLRPNFYLRQGHCYEKFSDTDMMGYVAYSVTDNSDKETSSIQAFIKDIFELTSPPSGDVSDPLKLMNNDISDLMDNMKFLKVNDVIPLFSM